MVCWLRAFGWRTVATRWGRTFYVSAVDRERGRLRYCLVWPPLRAAIRLYRSTLLSLSATPTYFPSLVVFWEALSRRLP